MATYLARAYVGTRIHELGTGLTLVEALGVIERACTEGLRIYSGEAPHHVLVYPPHRIDQLEAVLEESPPA